MNATTLSARRTRPDPTTILWTVMYYASGELRPYCPEYTALTWKESRGLLLRLKATFPQERLSLKPHQEEHLTVEQGRKALGQLFRQADRHELLPVADVARMEDFPVLANIAFRLQRGMAADAALDRTNERRLELGLRPVPRPAARPLPEIGLKNGRVVLHLGGSR